MCPMIGNKTFRAIKHENFHFSKMMDIEPEKEIKDTMGKKTTTPDN